jgi:hypothetical protein
MTVSCVTSLIICRDGDPLRNAGIPILAPVLSLISLHLSGVRERYRSKQQARLDALARKLKEELMMRSKLANEGNPGINKPH